MGKKKIAIVDEDASTAALVAGLLGKDYFCYTCTDFSRAVEFVQEKNPDLLVLDYDLVGKNGVRICQEVLSLKGQANLPIVFTSARSSVDEKIKAFEAGASDFVFRPFDAREFLLRIKAKFRMQKPVSESHIILGNCRLDFFSRRVFIKGKEVNLTRRQFDILTTLAKKKNEAVTREELITSICGGKENLSKRNIDTQISYMKRNLAEFDWAFEAVHGKGYRLTEEKKQTA